MTYWMKRVTWWLVVACCFLPFYLVLVSLVAIGEGADMLFDYVANIQRDIHRWWFPVEEPTDAA